MRSPLLTHCLTVCLTILAALLPLGGCRSKPITNQTMEGSERAKVFNAAREVLRQRFGTFSVVDEEQGKLVTSPYQPDGSSNGRYLAAVEISDDVPPQIKIEVVTEVLSFQQTQVVWTRYPRGKPEQNVEGYILEAIRAKLEDREPDLPSLDDLDQLKPPPPKHRVPKSKPIPKDRDAKGEPGQAPALPSGR